MDDSPVEPVRVVIHVIDQERAAPTTLTEARRQLGWDLIAQERAAKQQPVAE